MIERQHGLLLLLDRGRRGKELVLKACKGSTPLRTKVSLSLLVLLAVDRSLLLVERDVLKLFLVAKGSGLVELSRGRDLGFVRLRGANEGE
jgi:hypothetical protein